MYRSIVTSCLVLSLAATHRSSRSSTTGDNSGESRAISVADAFPIRPATLPSTAASRGRGSPSAVVGECGTTTATATTATTTELRVASLSESVSAASLDESDIEKHLQRHLAEITDRGRRRVAATSASASASASALDGNGSKKKRGGKKQRRRRQTRTVVENGAGAIETTLGDGGLGLSEAPEEDEEDVWVTAAEATSTTSSSSAFPPRLTREEEAEISSAVRALREALRVRDDLALSSSSSSSSSSPAFASSGRGGTGGAAVPSEREWAEALSTTVPHLLRTIRSGQQARTLLVSSNSGLVKSLARKYHAAIQSSAKVGGTGGTGSILTLQDLIQEGNLGLMEAAERFEPERGFRFSTYASYWARQRMLRSIEESSRVIRLPSHVHSMLNTIRKAQRNLEADMGRPPTTEELASFLSIPHDKLKLYTSSSRNVLSLENPLNGSSGGRGGRSGDAEGDGRRLGDVIASPTPTPEEDALSQNLRRDVRAVLDGHLSHRERDVLVVRFGLDDGTPKSLGETAKVLGLSRDRVRTVEARALNKLRDERRNGGLKGYVGGGGGGSGGRSGGGDSRLYNGNYDDDRLYSGGVSNNIGMGEDRRRMGSGRYNSAAAMAAEEREDLDDRRLAGSLSPESLWSF